MKKVMLNKRNSMSKRDYRIDNIKGILVLFVVFGHLLELVLKNNAFAHMIYIFIYLFHMPVFIFTTGYFAKCNIKKVICNLFYPYLIFQTLYQLFAIEVLDSNIDVQYGTPYWLLWYLFATVIWTLTEPLWNWKQSRKWIDGMILGLFLVLSLACGEWSFIGREYSLSRILVFFPFFVAGTFTRKWTIRSQKEKNFEEDPYIREYLMNLREIIKGFRKGIVLCLTGITTVYVVLSHQQIDKAWVYEATNYETSHYGASFRIWYLLAGFLFVWAALEWIPNKKWRGITNLGSHTLQVFLLHGFLIKLMSHFKVGTYLVQITDKKTAVMILLMTTAVIAYLLSRNVLTKVMKPLTSFEFFWRRRTA